MNAVTVIVGIVVLLSIAWLLVTLWRLESALEEQRSLVRHFQGRADRMHDMYQQINDDWHKDSLEWIAIAERQYAKGKVDGRNEANNEKRLLMLQESGEVKRFTQPVSEFELVRGDDPAAYIERLRKHVAALMVVDLYEQGYGLRTEIGAEVRHVDDTLSGGMYHLVCTATCVPLIAPLPADHLAMRNPTFNVDVPMWWWSSEPYSPNVSDRTSVVDEPRSGEQE
jgi:hypothetical protein